MEAGSIILSFIAGRVVAQNRQTPRVCDDNPVYGLSVVAAVDKLPAAPIEIGRPTSLMSDAKRWGGLMISLAKSKISVTVAR